MTRKIKNLIKDFSISSFNYSGGMGGGEAGVDPPTTTKGDLSGFDTTFDRVPIGTNNQVLTADSTEALGLKWAAASSGDMVKLEQVTLASNANSVVVTSTTYPYADYAKFLVYMELDSDGTGGYVDLSFQMNSQTANYGWINILNNGTSFVWEETSVQSKGLISDTFTQTENSIAELEILCNAFPSGERYMKYRGACYRYGNFDYNLVVGAASGTQFSELNRLEVFNDGDGDFLAGSIFTLYGLKK